MPNNNEFDLSEIRRFPDSAQVVIRLAHYLGWRLRWENNRHFVLTFRSPDGNKQFNLPTTNIRANRIDSSMRALWHYSDRDRFTQIVAGHADMMRDPALARIVALFGTSIATQALERRVEESIEEERKAEKAVATFVEDKVLTQSLEEVDSEPVQEGWHRPSFEYDTNNADWWETTLPNGTTVWECRAHDEPFLATSWQMRAGHMGAFAHNSKRNSKRVVNTYRLRTTSGLSPCTMVQEHADGTRTYFCDICGVRQYSRATAKAISNHWKEAHRDQAEGWKQSGGFKGQRVNKGQVTTREETRTVMPNDDVPAAPMLDQIRSLLGVDPRVQQLEREIAELRQELLRANQRAADAEGKWEALTALVNGR